MDLDAHHPDFTGAWKLIRGESEFGFLPPPRLRIDTIVHDAGTGALQIRTRQKDASGDVTVDRDVVIDGDPVAVAIRGRSRTVRAYWGSPAAELVIETASEVSGGTRRIEDRWTLDPDGQWITIHRLHELPGGPVRQRLRLRRITSGPASAAR